MLVSILRVTLTLLYWVVRQKAVAVCRPNRFPPHRIRYRSYGSEFREEQMPYHDNMSTENNEK